VDSLYVRFKFGMSEKEFNKLAQEHPQLHDLVFDGGIVPKHRFQMRPVLEERGVGFTRDGIFYIGDRHKFIDWAKSCGLYGEADIQNLEYLICGELMKEMT